MERKSKNWCFTLNNYEDYEIEEIRSWDCIYVLFGYETCPTTGTPHLQGYVQWKNDRHLGGLKKLNTSISWRIAEGNYEQNYKYCTKDGKFEEYGQPRKNQGKRSDIENVKQMVHDGKSMEEICNEATSYQSMRMAELMLKYKKPTAMTRNVVWLWGPSGTGKTRWAWENYPDAVQIEIQNNFIMGYDGEESVIIDDIRRQDLRINLLLRMLDRYPMNIPIKGGHRAWNAKNIIITCPDPPENFCWKEDAKQLVRRCTEIKNFSGAEVGGNTDPDFIILDEMI